MTYILVGIGIIVLIAIALSTAGSKPYPNQVFETFSKGDLVQANSLMDSDPKLIKGRNVNGWTALHFASWKNQSEMVKLLLSRGAVVDARDKNHETPLHFTESRIIADQLLANGADINAKNRAGWTPLRSALKCKREDVAAFLRSRGARE
jgi:ankyrin repeat protein